MLTKPQAVGGGAIITGGAVAGTSSKGDDYNLEGVDIPNFNFTVLAWENDYDRSYGTGTVGNKYAWYLTGTYGISYKDAKLELDLKNNEKWWEWSFNRWKVDTYKYKANKSGEFSSSNVMFAYSSSWLKDKKGSDKALNRVCESIYKLKASEWTDEESLLRYCSPMGRKPIVIKNSKTSYSPGIFGEARKETLVSVSDDVWNNMFFYLKGNEFFGKVDGDGIGKDLTNKNKYFYKLYAKKSPNTNRKNDIYVACFNAYISYTTSSDVDFSDLDKYCSWNIK